MIDWYLSFPRWKRITALMCCNIALATFIVWAFISEAEREQRFQRYLEQHRCERTGFAGKLAEPVYKCATGLWLEHEIKDKI